MGCSSQSFRYGHLQPSIRFGTLTTLTERRSNSQGSACPTPKLPSMPSVELVQVRLSKTLASEQRDIKIYSRGLVGPGGHILFVLCIHILCSYQQQFEDIHASLHVERRMLKVTSMTVTSMTCQLILSSSLILWHLNLRNQRRYVRMHVRLPLCKCAK